MRIFSVKKLRILIGITLAIDQINECHKLFRADENTDQPVDYINEMFIRILKMTIK